MMSSKFVAAIHVQYSALVGSAFKDAVLTHISHVQRLETIHLCDMARQRSDAPSWVPSFGDIDGASLAGCFEQFSSGFSRTHVSHVPSGALRVYGVMIAEVQSVDEIGWEQKGDSVLIDLSKHPAGLFTAKYVSGGSLLEAYLSMLLVGRLRDRYPLFQSDPTIQDWAHTYTSVIPKPQETLSKTEITTDPTGETAHSTKLPLDRFLTQACVWQTGRGLIQTDTGHIGLGPLVAQPGQFILQQRSWPFIVLIGD